MFNLREGLNPIKFPYPTNAQKILRKGPLKDIKIDLKTMQKEFYSEMEWDPETGIPSSKKLKELQIDDVKYS